MAIRDRELTTPRCMNKIDWMQFKKQEKRICNYGCILGSVMQQPSVAYAIHGIYDNNEHTLVWVASWLPRIRIG
jgi:hypothetical protein